MPHVGTWIEMITAGLERAALMMVVPHVGTWIEIPRPVSPTSREAVVPHVGTWIEIHAGFAVLAIRARSCLT